MIFIEKPCVNSSFVISSESHVSSVRDQWTHPVAEILAAFKCWAVIQAFLHSPWNKSIIKIQWSFTHALHKITNRGPPQNTDQHFDQTNYQEQRTPKPHVKLQIITPLTKCAEIYTCHTFLSNLLINLKGTRCVLTFILSLFTAAQLKNWILMRQHQFLTSPIAHAQ